MGGYVPDFGEGLVRLVATCKTSAPPIRDTTIALIFQYSKVSKVE